MKNKTMGTISIVFGLINMASVFFNQEWYLILCFVGLGVIPVVFGFKCMAAGTAEGIRGTAWADIVAGASILSLAMSDFYGSTNLPFIQYITSAVLIIIGAMGLYTAVKKGGLTFIP